MCTNLQASYGFGMDVCRFDLLPLPFIPLLEFYLALGAVDYLNYPLSPISLLDLRQYLGFVRSWVAVYAAEKKHEENFKADSHLNLVEQKLLTTTP